MRDGSHTCGDALKGAGRWPDAPGADESIWLCILLGLTAMAPGKRLHRLRWAVAFKCGSEPQLHPRLATQSGLLSMDPEGHCSLDATRDKLLSAMASRVDAAARGPYEPGDKDMFLHPPARNPAAAKTSVCMLLQDSVPRDDKGSRDSYGWMHLGQQSRVAVDNSEGKTPHEPRNISVRMHALMCALRWGWHEAEDACHAVGAHKCNVSHKHCINPLHLAYKARGQNVSDKGEAADAVHAAAAAKAARARSGIGKAALVARGASETVDRSVAWLRVCGSCWRVRRSLFWAAEVR
jgi:hypothetical protein